MIIYTCLVCLNSNRNVNFNHPNALTNHLKIHKINSKKYYDDYIKKHDEELCVMCKIAPTRFQGFIKGYSNNCHSCGSKIAAKLQWSGESGKERKNKQSIRMECNRFSNGRPKNSKNKSSYPMTDSVIARNKENPPPSWARKKHTKETKEKQSISRNNFFENGGKVMASHKGKFNPKNPQKYKGNSNNIIYRSSWECRVMSHFDLNENVLSWQSEELRIPYISPIDNRKHSYYPDFVIVVKNKQGHIETMMIEVKPLYQTTPPILTEEKKNKKSYIREVLTWGVNSAKWAAAEKYCKEQKWKFIIMTEKEIFGK